MSDDAFARKLAELGAAFRAQLPATLDDMRQQLRRGNFSEVRSLAHQMAGRGGTFGAPEITVAACRVEDADDDAITMEVDALARVIGAAL